MKNTILLFLAVGLLVSAQEKPQEKPQEKVEEGKLTFTETTALNVVSGEFAKAQKDLAQVELDIQRNHPGYHFDQNLGQLVKNPEPKPEVKPEKK